MNVQLKDITVTARDGRVSHLEQVYIRGSHVRYFIVPDMLRSDHTIFLGRLNADDLQECAHVPVEGYERSRCWSCTWSSHGQQSEGDYARWTLRLFMD